MGKKQRMTEKISRYQSEQEFDEAEKTEIEELVDVSYTSPL